MMETFLEDAENSLHHRNNAHNDSCSSDESDDPFLYDKFLPDPDWAKRNKQEEEEKPKALVDPGVFRYNKRVFVTSFPACLLVLALGGETLVLMTALGTALITIMSQLGDSRRCVVTFVILFIPTHTYVLACVLPFLWLSFWHVFLVVLVNVYVILTGGWTLLQFKAFRMEEPSLAGVIEQMLFTLYPLMCTSLVCWALASVLSVLVIPIIFSLTWFVLLQLYLIPTLSSFRSESTPDENLDVVQMPMVALTVATFVALGPLLHCLINLVTLSGAGQFSLLSAAHFVFILSMCLFLATLLSIRQIFEYLGMPYTTAIYVRWVSGVVCTLISYPVMRDYGLDSHFLPLLPVAIAIFAALGVVLAFKKRRVVMAVLAMVLVSSLLALFFIWIQGMPHNLQHYFMGIFPLNVFYSMMCGNFLLCLLCLWTASVDAQGMLAFLLVLQAGVHTVCEVSLHNAGLYSTSLLQLTSVSAAYTIHRLQLAERVSRQAAIVSSAVYLAKALASATSLVLDGDKGEITLMEMVTLGFMSYALLSVFVYGGLEDPSGLQVTKQILSLLLALAINSYHFLLPLSMLMFQGSTSFTNVIGLWCMLGGSAVLLYSQTASSPHTQHVLKLALGLGIAGITIMLLHPRLAITFHSLFQWAEILNFFALATILTSQMELSAKGTVVLSLFLAACPGIRVSLFLWGQITFVRTALCLVDVGALLALVFICLFISEMSDASDRVVKYSVSMVMGSVLGLLVTDIASLWSAVAFWNLPAWRAMVVSCLAVCVILKLVQVVKGPDRLPLRSESEASVLTMPVLSNLLTVFTFFVACSQGPSDPFLHDLWCCAATVILGCLHGDSFLIPRLDREKQATPTILTSLAILTLASILRSRLWASPTWLTTMGGLIELLLVLVVAPIFVVLATILWTGQAASEPLVVFTTPYCVLLLLVASSYTAWVAAIAGLVAGTYMMLYKLPMVPYHMDYEGHYR